MSESKNTINDLAAQYLDMWQKQMTAKPTNSAVEDAVKASQEFSQQSQEFLQSVNSPEKMQDWMTTWANSWKAQFEDGTNPFENFAPFTTGNAAPGSASSSPAHEHTEHKLDELTRRISLLEERIAALESGSKE